MFLRVSWGKNKQINKVTIFNDHKKKKRKKHKNISSRSKCVCFLFPTQGFVLSRKKNHSY